MAEQAERVAGTISKVSPLVGDLLAELGRIAVTVAAIWGLISGGAIGTPATPTTPTTPTTPIVVKVEQPALPVMKVEPPVPSIPMATSVAVERMRVAAADLFHAIHALEGKP